MDVVYLVRYDGVHEKSVLYATSDEGRAIEAANKAQGFRVEKWENGKRINPRHYDGTLLGKMG